MQFCLTVRQKKKTAHGAFGTGAPPFPGGGTGSSGAPNATLGLSKSNHDEVRTKFGPRHAALLFFIRFVSLTRANPKLASCDNTKTVRGPFCPNRLIGAFHRRSWNIRCTSFCTGRFNRRRTSPCRTPFTAPSGCRRKGGSPDPKE